jgi:ADP-ribose pyrophosphatase
MDDGSEDSTTRAGWTRLSTRRAFECPWFSVRQDEIRLPGGDEITYNVVEHGGFALVVPVRSDGLVVMERVYRWTLDDWLLECPSGGLDGDAPEIAAGRELEEETGYRARAFDHLGQFAASDGYTNERFDAFLARDVTPDGRLSREPTEQMEIELYPMAELREHVLRGEIEDAPSALAILLAAERLRSER